MYRRIFLICVCGLFVIGQAAARFRLRALGDVQMSNRQEVEYASRSLFAELLEPTDSLQVIDLFVGDIVNKDVSLMPIARQMFERLPDPYYTVLGNHDRDWQGTCDVDSTYAATFGKPYYSFNLEKVHLVALNNVFTLKRRDYRGHIPTEQLEWLERDLAQVPADRQLVVAMHIPAFSTDNVDSLLHIVEARGFSRLLFLTGHLHQVARGVVVRPSGLEVQELSVGATCGFWWVGERDVEGVPSALMQDGTPRGYFVIDFDDDGSYTFRFKGVGHDASQQTTIHVSGLDSLDTYVDSLAVRKPGEVYVTVYGACDSTEVRCQLDHGAWIKGRQVPVMDSNVARQLYYNQQKIYPTRHNRINPTRRLVSRQVWRFDFDPAQLKGVHLLRIEASDRFGFHASGSKLFWF